MFFHGKARLRQGGWGGGVAAFVHAAGHRGRQPTQCDGDELTPPRQDRIPRNFSAQFNLVAYAGICLISALLLSANISQASQFPWAMKPMLKLLDHPLPDNPSADTVRNGAIAYLSANTNGSVAHYQSQTNDQLFSALQYAFHLQQRGVKPNHVRTLTVDGMRNTSIVVVNKRLGTSIATLQGMTSYDILKHDKINIGYINGLPHLEKTKWPNDPELNLKATTTECTDLDRAESEISTYTNDLHRLRAEHADVERQIHNYLNRDFFSSFTRGTLGMTDISYINMLVRRDNLKQQIAETSVKLDNSKLLRESVVRQCLECLEKRGVFVRTREFARRYNRFTDYLHETRRSWLKTVERFKNVPNSDGANQALTQAVNQLSNVESVLWQHVRYSFVTRHDPVPLCR
ncbi:MAG: hypothetical protein AAF441_12315 [Pseudomonadota bacterium]